MTDSELDEAVLRAGCWQIDTRPGAPDRAFEAFRPTSDARDAERVWDWLLETHVEVMIARWPVEGGTSGVFLDGQLSDEDIASLPWKRALCLAALRVARNMPKEAT